MPCMQLACHPSRPRGSPFGTLTHNTTTGTNLLTNSQPLAVCSTNREHAAHDARTHLKFEKYASSPTIKYSPPPYSCTDVRT